MYDFAVGKRVRDYVTHVCCDGENLKNSQPHCYKVTIRARKQHFTARWMYFEFKYEFICVQMQIFIGVLIANIILLP